LKTNSQEIFSLKFNLWSINHEDDICDMLFSFWYLMITYFGFVNFFTVMVLFMIKNVQK
jgi:hypothetical protein